MSTQMRKSKPSRVASAAPSGAPTNRTVPSVIAFSELALLRSGPLPTTAGTCACAAGRNSTEPALSRASAKYNSQTVSGDRTSSRTETATARNRSVEYISRRRSQRSVSTPANGPNSSNGRYSAARVSPVAISEPVRCRTYAGTAMTSSQLPNVLTSRPDHSSRKSRMRSAANMRPPGSVSMRGV